MSQLVYAGSIRSGLSAAIGLRDRRTWRSCGNCRHWLVAGGMGHCERLNGWHGPVQSGHGKVCSRWVRLEDVEVVA